MSLSPNGADVSPELTGSSWCLGPKTWSRGRKILFSNRLGLGRTQITLCQDTFSLSWKQGALISFLSVAFDM